MRDCATPENICVAGVIVLAALFVGSCVRDYVKSTPRAAYVTIVDKDYQPGHTVTHCSSDGKHMSCSSSWVPPSWRVEYEDAAERFSVSVSSGEYEALRLGDRKVLNYNEGGGYWHARYSERILLVAPPAEGAR